LAFDVPQLSERLPEGIPPVEAGCVRCAEIKQPDEWDLPWGLLRPGGERRGEEAERDAGDECPPIHHSIT
jgi:hypothetical protein